MKFTKMQGLGNDYLYVFGEVPEDIVPLCVSLSERHFGAGSDGMVFISKSDCADFRMRIFNADGSEAMMCGNGIRCVGKYVHDKGYTDKTELDVETLSGIKHLSLNVEDGKVKTVAVNMGRAKVGAEAKIDVDGKTVTYIPINVGNPHAVVFVDDIETAPLTTLGPLMERHPAFPGGVNVEFVAPLGDSRLKMRVWERGSGVTMACGTGACASASAAVMRGICAPDTSVALELDGGELTITVSDDYEVTMTGPAEFVYEGDTEIC